jgi:hypothetical protein
MAAASSNFMDCCAAASEGANIAIMNSKSRIRVMAAPHTRRVAMVKCSVRFSYVAPELLRRSKSSRVAQARTPRYAIAHA